MFELADHNAQSLRSCLEQVSSGAYAGVFIPAGRFYMRGTVVLPSHASVQGAGMWYSKLTAVDTESPSAVTVGGKPGIAGRSGNFGFVSAIGGSTGVTVSNLAFFGNVTQRDTVDDVLPFAVHGELTSNVLDNLWVERCPLAASARTFW